MEIDYLGAADFLKSFQDRRIFQCVANEDYRLQIDDAAAIGGEQIVGKQSRILPCKIGGVGVEFLTRKSHRIFLGGCAGKIGGEFYGVLVGIFVEIGNHLFRKAVMPQNLRRECLAIGRGDDVGVDIDGIDNLLRYRPCKRIDAEAFRIALGEYIAGIAIDINDIHIEVVAEGLHDSHLAIVAEHTTALGKMLGNYRGQRLACGNLQATAHQALPYCRTCRLVHAVAKRCHAT